jgi:hypothetical protein
MLWKGLKIPNGLSESVNRRITDNTMTKEKSTKGHSPDALPFSEHLQISVDIKLFVHDRVTSTF